MNRSRFTFFVLSFALLLPIISGTLLGAVKADEEGEDSLYKYLSVFSEVLSLVRRTYVEETSIETLFAGAMNGTTDALDALSTYVPADAVEEYRHALEVGTRRSGLAVAKERGIAYVLAAAAGGPGATVGLETGDLLTELNGISTRRMPLWRMQSLLAGPVGTEIEIDYLRRGRPESVTLTLEEFPAPPPQLERRDGIPVLRLPVIEAGVEEKVRNLLVELAEQGGGELIVDLSANAGGDPTTAYRVASLFAGGKLGELRGPSGVIETFESDSAPLWNGRLVVLTDRGSQGACEVLAVVLRQAVGAELVGERTFGHAGRHRLVALSSGAQVYLTDAFYTGPDGTPLNEGLEPVENVRASRRHFDETDMPLRELILKRGIERLRAEEVEQAA